VFFRPSFTKTIPDIAVMLNEGKNFGLIKDIVLYQLLNFRAFGLHLLVDEERLNFTNILLLLFESLLDMKLDRRNGVN
jgi:hypothetical protein